MAGLTTAQKRLALEVTGSLARIVLTHPPLNVIDFQMMDELLEALRELERRPEVSVLVLSGADGGFSAGVDVAVHTPEKIKTMLEKFHGVIGALAKYSKITIAKCMVSAWGAGRNWPWFATSCTPRKMPSGAFPKSPWAAILPWPALRCRRSLGRSALPNSCSPDGHLQVIRPLIGAWPTKRAPKESKSFRKQ